MFATNVNVQSAVCLYFVVILFRPSEQRPLAANLPSDKMLLFMRQYGYLHTTGPDAENLYKEETISDAIKTMQKFGGLPETGVMDASTESLMSRKRCGVQDISSSSTRSKRYIIGADGWNKSHLTYFLANWSPKLKDWHGVMSELERAFGMWSDYARLKFTHVNSPEADIIIFFARGPHGDGYPMDGPGNILAHAFFPYDDATWGGDIHFDEDENWEMGEGDGVDFFTVAAHEIGHSLGLSHSPVPGSLMFPYYKGYDTHFQLDYDDILAVYQLYVMRLPYIDDSSDLPPAIPTTEPTTPETTTEQASTTTDSIFSPAIDDEDYENDGAEDPRDEETETEVNVATNDDDNVSWNDGDQQWPPFDDSYGDTYEYDYDMTTKVASTTTMTTTTTTETSERDDRRKNTTHDRPDLCDGSYDAITLMRNELFVFKDRWVWRFRKRGQLEPGYPVPIHDLFRFPYNTWMTRVDAIYERPDHKIMIFSGRSYWISDGNTFTTQKSLPLTSLGIPDDVDKLDAAFVWGKNGKTYFFSSDQYWRYNDSTKTMDPGYPQHLSRWRGVPSGVDTVFRWSDGMTYFFKGEKYYRFNDQQVMVDGRYPLSAPEYWFGCFLND